MRTIVFDVPTGREEFLVRLCKTSELQEIELASHIHLEHISNLPWKKIHVLSSPPSNLDENVTDFAKIVGHDKVRIVTFNEGSLVTLAALQRKYCEQKFWFTTRLGKVRSKYEVRKILEKNGHSVPSYFIDKNSMAAGKNLDFLGVPKWIAKPDQGMGGRSVRLISSQEEALKYLSELAPMPTNYPIVGSKINLTEYWGSGFETIFEEFVDGPEYSAETVFLDGELQNFVVTQKFTSGIPYFLELAHVTLPPEHYPLSRQILEQELKKISKTLELKTSLVHFEFKVRDHKMLLIEANLRPAGGEICEIWRLAIGLDLLRLHVFPEFNGNTIDASYLGQSAAVIHHTHLGSGVPDFAVLEQIETTALQMNINMYCTILKHKNESHVPVNTEVGFRYAKSIFIAENYTRMKKFIEALPSRGFVQ
jgi:hypothetical protein